MALLKVVDMAPLSPAPAPKMLVTLVTYLPSDLVTQPPGCRHCPESHVPLIRARKLAEDHRTCALSGRTASDGMSSLSSPTSEHNLITIRLSEPSRKGLSHDYD